MASNYFTYSPTSGTGTKAVNVQSKAANTGTADKKSIIEVTNGTTTRQLLVTQKYRPYFSQNGVSFPKSGGTITFVVHTEYDIVFKNKPAWITIKNGSTTISPDTKISKEDASGATFTLSATTNSGASRSFSNFGMGHYVNNVLDDYVQYFTGTQDGASSSERIAVSTTSITLDYFSTGSSMFGVTVISPTTGVNISNSNTTRFSITPTSGINNSVFTVTPTGSNTSTGNYTGTCTVSDTQGEAASKSVSLKQKYRPYFLQNSQVVPGSGGTVTFVVHTEYDIVFQQIPSWITVKKGNTTYTEGQRIAKEDVDGQTLTLTGTRNTGQDPETDTRRVTDTFNMGHYIGNNIQSYLQYFYIEQEIAALIVATPSAITFTYKNGSNETFLIETTGVTNMHLINSNPAFALSPTSGQAGLYTASTIDANTTTSAKTSVITINDDGNNAASKTVTLTQGYRPYLIQSTPAYIQYAGGSIYFTVHTQYDIRFEQIPSWITLTLNGSAITENQRISASTADNQQFVITAGYNTGDTRNVMNTFCMAHFIGNTVQGYKSYISFSQDANGQDPEDRPIIYYTINGHGLDSGVLIKANISCETNIRGENEMSVTTNGSGGMEPVYGYFEGAVSSSTNIVVRFTLTQYAGGNMRVTISYNNGAEAQIQTILPGGYVQLTTPYVEDAQVEITLENA